MQENEPFIQPEEPRKKILPTEESSVGTLALQLLKLTGKLLKALLGKLAKWVLKGGLWLTDKLSLLWNKLKGWWNSNSTQEKLGDLKRKGKKAAVATGKALCKGTKTAAIWSWDALKWLWKKTLHALTHLKPVMRKLWQKIVEGGKSSWKGICSFFKGCAAWGRRKKEAWAAFRQNKGFKGLLIDFRNLMNEKLTDFMKEESAATDAPAEENEDRKEESNNDADNTAKEGKKTFGKKIYDSLKEMVEDDG